MVAARSCEEERARPVFHLAFPMPSTPTTRVEPLQAALCHQLVSREVVNHVSEAGDVGTIERNSCVHDSTEMGVDETGAAPSHGGGVVPTNGVGATPAV